MQLVFMPPATSEAAKRMQQRSAVSCNPLHAQPHRRCVVELRQQAHAGLHVFVYAGSAERYQNDMMSTLSCNSNLITGWLRVSATDDNNNNNFLCLEKKGKVVSVETCDRDNVDQRWGQSSVAKGTMVSALQSDNMCLSSGAGSEFTVSPCNPNDASQLFQLLPADLMPPLAPLHDSLLRASSATPPAPAPLTKQDWLRES